MMTKNETRNREISQSMTIGFLAGMRTFSAPAAVVRAKYPRLQRPFEALAVLEMMRDKSSSMPNRIDPLPLTARGLSGAISAALAGTSSKELSLKKGRGMLAFIGGITAMTSAYGIYYLRRTLGAKLGIKDNVLGLVEDAAAVRIRKSIMTRRAG